MNCHRKLTQNYQQQQQQKSYTIRVYNNNIVYRHLWSRPIPLGWYFKPQWEIKYGYNWPEKLCNKWILNDRNRRNFPASIPICPCTLKHALNDKGRFLPDRDCDIDTQTECKFNKQAIHCVTSGTPR